MPIPIIDLFAGPGGLGEGFSSILNEKNEKVFEIKLSIEKDVNAHETLRLRSFFRQFPKGEVPEKYYEIVRQKSWKKRKALIDNLKFSFKNEWEAAEKESWCFELPYPEEFNKKGEKKGGYTDKQIVQRNKIIDERIKIALNGEKNFLLIGGPPCQAYSVVGRSRNKGIFREDHRVHLYKEYLRIIAKHHPAVFVMENVKGLLSSELDGVQIFDLIKKDLSDPSTVFTKLKSPKYKIYALTKEPSEIENEQPIYSSNRDYLIHSEEYGIPQKRHRVILLGLREDVEHTGHYIKTKEEIALNTVIGQLPKIRSGISKTFIGYDTVQTYSDGSPKRLYQYIKDNKENWKELQIEHIQKLKGWGNLILNGLSRGPKYFKNGTGAEYIKYRAKTIDDDHLLANWYRDERLEGVANHESRSHLKEDLLRYLFAGLYACQHETSPKLSDYAQHHRDLIPEHSNADSGKFADRFRVQLPKQPATTVTSHISKDGHYFIHYDPEQCRSLTVREAARIQTFPDNYLFCGSRTAQYHQVGNAVPPYLAKQIAEIVYKIFKEQK